MTSHKPSEPSPTDFGDAAKASQDAGMADENAAFDRAADENKGTPAEESSAHPS